MKRIIAAFFAVVFTAGSVFAVNVNGFSESADLTDITFDSGAFSVSPLQSVPYPEELLQTSYGKNTGFTVGARISILGLEPSFAYIHNNLEIGAAVAITRSYGNDWSLKTWGFAPSVCIGYNTKPFAKGYSSSIGLEYLFIPYSYVDALVGSSGHDDVPEPEIEEDEDSITETSTVTSTGGPFAAHALSVYYRGTWQVSNLLGFFFRLRLPLGLFADGEGITIIDGAAAWGVSTLVMFWTTSIGVQFTF